MKAITEKRYKLKLKDSRWKKLIENNKSDLEERLFLSKEEYERIRERLDRHRLATTLYTQLVEGPVTSLSSGLTIQDFHRAKDYLIAIEVARLYKSTVRLTGSGRAFALEQGRRLYD